MSQTAQVLPQSSNWLQDPETGFLYTTDPYRGDHEFSLQKKIAIIPIYQATFPSLTEAIKEVGISRQTFYWHLKFDHAFAAVIAEIRESKADKIESAMFQVAIQPKAGSFMDRIAMLRAYRPALYTEKRINLTAKDLEPSEINLKRQALESAIDGELVQGPRTEDNPTVAVAPGSSVPQLTEPNTGAGTLAPDPR